MDNQEPQGNSPIGWFVLALIVLIVLAALFVLPAGAHAQETSPVPNGENITLNIFRCHPSMVVLVTNEGDSGMERHGLYLWWGEPNYEILYPIAAGYSVVLEHQTARALTTITYFNELVPPKVQTIHCYDMYMPSVRRGDDRSSQ